MSGRPATEAEIQAVEGQLAGDALMPFWDHDPVPPPWLSGGRTRAHSWWPLGFALFVLFTVGVLLTLTLIAWHNA